MSHLSTEHVQRFCGGVAPGDFLVRRSQWAPRARESAVQLKTGEYKIKNKKNFHKSTSAAHESREQPIALHRVFVHFCMCFVAC